MDYERKYKEALKVIEGLYNVVKYQSSSDALLTYKTIEKAFPELKESEDDKNIKNLIDELKCSLRSANCQNDACGGGHEKRIALLEWGIAWLKKQNEKEQEQDIRSNYLEELIEADNIYQMAMNDAMVEEAKTKAIHALSKLEILNLLFQEDQNKKFFAVAKDQKFKTGDWIVTPDDQIKQIDNVTFGNYLFTDKTYHNIIDVDNKGHLWTINDAHDGDVLSFKDHRHYVIGIVKPIKGRNTVDAYCLIEYNSLKIGMFYNLDTEDPHPATNEQRNMLIGKMKEAGYEWDEEKKDLKKLSEQKEIKPKFKIGDWITDGSLFVGQVTSFDGEYYHYMCDGFEQPPIHDSNVYKWHLWTINDAHDGDVLVNKYGTIFINAGNNEEHKVTLDCYCYISVQGEFCLEEHKTGSWLYKTEIHPATKEQRDILFSKMKEAGYEWDEEKKELKKLSEQNGTDILEKEIPNIYDRYDADELYRKY